MEESTTYQLLIARGKEQGKAEGLAEGEARGKAEEARRLLLRIGRNRFGEPDAVVQAALSAAPLERLEQMADRMLQVETWQELLA